MKLGGFVDECARDTYIILPPWNFQVKRAKSVFHETSIREHRKSHVSGFLKFNYLVSSFFFERPYCKSHKKRVDSAGTEINKNPFEETVIISQEKIRDYARNSDKIFWD